MIDWKKLTKGDCVKLGDVAKRALSEGLILKEFYADRLMDFQAGHITCPMDLDQLLDFDEFNFAHDVCGIIRHLNRTTGELENCFVPRCSLPASGVLNHVND